jgi:predicted ABC-type sugar transport system permease subunit
MIATAAKDGFLSRVLGARETGLVLIILTLIVVLSFASLHFPTWTNMRAMAMAFSVEAIVVVGMTILLISGGIRDGARHGRGGPSVPCRGEPLGRVSRGHRRLRGG